MATQIQLSPEGNQALAIEAAKQIASATKVDSHEIALVLGSGWAAAPDLIGETVAEIPAHEIAGFHESAIAGHSGVISSIRLNNSKHALVLAARTHLYEGRGVDAVVHPIHVAAAAGAKTLILTNGAGGINSNFTAGQPVVIRDHINFTATSPLVGPRFIDMSEVYSKRLRDLAFEIDEELASGVYIQFRGPSYETPAEIRMARIMGADMVGMSTVLEAIAAREAGLEVLGLSLITNLAAGISPNPLSHAEVLEAGSAAAPKISKLLAKIIAKL
jgi:purine-nucleoside phosphorylase